MTDRTYLERLARELSDQGKLIEAGWIGFKHVAIPPSTPEAQINEMRMAFFAGAQHLFASINTILDPSSQPTDADLARMNLINTELEEFRLQLQLRLSQGR